MKVCKFGGTSLANAEQVAKIVDIVLADPERRIVVVSAPGKRTKDDVKVTDLLMACAELALVDGDYEAALAAIVERYAEIQRELGLPDGITAEIEKDLRFRLAGDKSHRGIFMDSMKAAGEDNSAKLVAQAFQSRGARATYMSPQDAGMYLTNDYDNARLLDESYQNIAKTLIDHDELVIFPGFSVIQKRARWRPSAWRFGHYRSDLGGGGQGQCLRDFTDVDSVYPVDPRLVPEVKSGIPVMTYREMRELSYAGFGVFHDEAVVPAIKAGVPINVRNTNRPEEPGTMIVQTRRVLAGCVVGIASDDGFCNIFVDKYMMNREVGFGRHLLQILEWEGVSYEHMPSGIDNVSVVIRDKNFSPECERRVVERIKRDLNPDAVLVERGYALIMVGRGALLHSGHGRQGHPGALRRRGQH